MKSVKEKLTMDTSVGLIIFWLLLSITLVKGDTKLVCSPGLNTSGVTVPQGDITLLYGEPLDIYCVLNLEHEFVKNEGYNSSHLIFVRGMDSVDPKFITIVNSSAIHLHIPQPPISDSMYYCRLLHHQGEVGVCLNNVIVGTKPQEVDNFECTSFNWSNLTCSWTPPHNYLKTIFSLRFYLPYRGGRLKSYPCPEVTMDTDTDKHYCIWDLSTDPPYRQPYPTYYFNLTSANKYGVITQNYTFNHYSHVKPNSPTNLTVDHKGPHSCQLHWSLPDPMPNFPPGVIHRIMYLTDMTDEWHTVNSSTLPLSSPDYSFHLTDLPYANRYYNVRIAIRSEKAVLERFWSENAAVTFRTLGKPPKRSPNVNIGSFEVSRSLNYRNITVYWEQLEVYEENGDGFIYTIEVLSEGKKIELMTTEKGYASFKNLPLKPLQILISTSNKEGISPNKSSIMIPPQDEIIKEPTYFTNVELGNKTFELDWKPPEVNLSLVESYTIFWCDSSRERPHQCDGHLKWINVTANSTSKNFTVPDDKRYQFAVSANGYGSSSGMVWASCTVIPDKAVGKLKEIWIPRFGSTFIQVSWKLECTDNVGVIKGYRISWCPIYGLQNTTCRDGVKLREVMDNNNKDVLIDLKPYTTYAIQVAIIAKHEIGPMSDAVLATTSEAAPEPPQNVSVSEITAKKMLVSWQKPNNTNGVLRYYLVCYRSNETGPWETIKVEKEAYNKKELTRLDSYTNYTIIVKACTVDCSIPSEELLVRTAIGTPGVIARPTADSYDQSQVLAWDRPAYAGGPLDFYTVRRITVKQSGNETEDFNTTDFSMRFDGRGCQKEDILGYFFIVKATNLDLNEDHGVAAFSHMERVKIDKGMPDESDASSYSGPWSSHALITCSVGYSSAYFIYWFICPVAVILVVILGFCIKMTWKKIDKMRSIKPIMPDGLFPESEKDSKYPLGNWNPPPKHTKELDAQYPSASADEESLLKSPSLAPPSPKAVPTIVSASGGSSCRANSPTWPLAGSWPTDESDVEVTVQSEDNPYVSVARVPASFPVPGGYVQAAMLPSIPKENPTNAMSTALPSNYVVTASELPRTSVETPHISELPSNYVRTAPESVVSPMPRVAVVSPYVTVDDARFAPVAQPLEELKKEPKSGYVTHNHSMFNNNTKIELPVLEHPKRISAPPLLNNIKLNNNDSNKRISLTNNYTTIGLNNLTTNNIPYSPEYCRFGWNGTENMDPSHSIESQSDAPTTINLSNLSKEEYELPLDLLDDEEEMTNSSKDSKPDNSTAAHYIPLGLHS